jgi:hypothetical protein
MSEALLCYHGEDGSLQIGPRSGSRQDADTCPYCELERNEPQDAHRKGTCGTCGKVRKLFKYNFYYYACSECIKLTASEKRKAQQTREAAKQHGETARFAYPIVGGPLDGEYAITADFYRGGIYEHLDRNYQVYNAARGGHKKIGGWPPTMIFIHSSLLQALARPKER